MKFCTNCGAKLNDDDVFCYKCGTKCAPMVAEEPKAEEQPAQAVPPQEEPKIEEEPMIVEEPAEEPFLEEPEEDEEAKRQAEEEARRQAEEEEKRRAEEEAKRQAEEEARQKAEEEARRQAEEEARRKAEEEKRRAEEEARLAEERKQKEQRLADIEKERAENKKQDASLREEENKLRAELSLPIKEEPKEASNSNEGFPTRVKSFLVDEDEFHSPTLLFHSVVFFGILVVVSLIYWLIGAFTNIHVAIRVVLFFLTLGTIALPVLEIVKLVVYMIKNKKINLFVVIILGIIQILSWVFISINFSAIFS